MTALEEGLTRVLARSVPDFVSLDGLERLSGGASQETYRISITTRAGARRLAMRRAPGGISAAPVGGEKPGLALEARLMEVAREAGVPEPRIVHVLEPVDGIGEGFVMEWLEGEALGARIARAPEFDAVRPGLAYQCGQLLARIHGIDLDATGLRGRLGVLEPETFVRQKWEQYQLFATPQPMIDYTARWLLEHLPPRGELALVHNDFRNGNLMISPDTGVVAVLDWEVAHIGDPMRDLGWICTNSWRFGRSELPVGGFGTYADLFRGYESVSGRGVDPAHVKFWEVFGSYWWAIGCLGMGMAYRNGPDRTVERPGIARRTSECQVDCVNLLFPGPVSLPEKRRGASSSDLPHVDELVTSVRDFLRDDVMAATKGRTNFLARVASNSLDIVLRELELGAAHAERERAGLVRVLGAEGDLDALRWTLVRGLRDGSIALDTPGLTDHLRQTVVAQVAIDQPKYTGLATALAHGSPRT
jgi:aminoglycoside phosphotransferase (APT) family kinase protein